MASHQDTDTLAKTIRFLQKREGIDKTLKIIRYTSRLVAAVSPPGSETRARFDALQSSIGTSRKAYRLGKFLQNYVAARSVTISTGTAAERVLGGLQLVNALGEGTYYFLDQFLWLMKAGFVAKTQEARVQKVSAWAEAIGYAANISLSLYKLRQLSRHRAQLQRKLLQRHKDGEQQEPGLQHQLQLMHAAIGLRVALIVQDLADALLALHDITARALTQHPWQDPAPTPGHGPLRCDDAAALVLATLCCVHRSRGAAGAADADAAGADGRHQRLSHPVVLSVAGLVSAAVSTYKYWGT